LISSKSFVCDCKVTKSKKEIQKRESLRESKYISMVEILKIDSKKHFEIKVIESFKGVLNGVMPESTINCADL
jgi:hypothetical protein